jgi:uncharacterized protein (TIGR03083 family)
VTYDVWAATDQVRQQLAADLANLTAQQWDAPSLCSEWRVRDVVAHLTVEANTTVRSLTVGLVRHRFNVNRYLGREAIEAGQRPTEELLRDFTATIGTRTLPPMTPPVCLLSDIVCHAADIRWPLGLADSTDTATFKAAADFTRSDRMTGSKRRVRGLRWLATDADWATGDGPLIEGPLEALLLGMAGRAAALDTLDGPGIAVLAARIHSA